ncbi:MAG: DUF5107 domain-containing protein [Pirellulales bacterium]|nr:DUF5107 domain-containing protein [Pirellulales bacterium]
MTQEVRAWREPVVIPTYGIGSPNPNPMFIGGRVYQGSSGKVYPLPVVDRIEDQRHDETYDAVFLENEFLKIMVLPERGGRVQMALDKTNDYHFVYYNRVIKPALVGLAGPWVSGGIEFNWPQHHRPTTFMPMACEIVENSDGSYTAWCHEIDRMYGTKGMHGFTLHPGRAILEVKAQLYNRTDQPQSFLWWANPACHVDEHHQSIFPPDVRAVMDHGRRDVSSFPIATGTYYKVNYSPGTDISRYSNIPVPTSYMAEPSDYDFVASYDHRRQAGLVHVADHHISPGKKQWTWGTGQFGQAWDRHLTDEDGPYIELMCGVYTDNQPDFSWIDVGECRSFSQIFMPYKGVGAIKNATTEAAIGLESCGREATVRVYVTREQPNCRVVLSRGDGVLMEETFDGTPRKWLERKVDLGATPGLDGCRLRVADSAGRTLVAWQVDEPREKEIPKPARAIAPPGQIDSTESLYLAGLHLQQYRHATRDPEDYFREGLRRDPGDIRCNIALGALLFGRGLFADAEALQRRAIERLTRHNPNPNEGEAHYQLGLTLAMQERFDEAYAAFYKAAWNATRQDVAYFQLARIAVRRGNYSEAEQLLERCLDRNAHHGQARHLLVLVLDKLGRTGESRAHAEEALADDPFNFGVLAEVGRLDCDYGALHARTGGDWNNYLETAIDYGAAGLAKCATAVLQEYLDSRQGPSESPLVYYYLADSCRSLASEAHRWYAIAKEADPSLCFPNKLTDIGVLERAAAENTDDARASYYLGNLWYDRGQSQRAIACWEDACRRDPTYPTAWRNLGLAYYNDSRNPAMAWEAIERAFELRAEDARVLYELDQLARHLNHGAEDRLTRLDAHRAAVNGRDDLYLEYAALLNLVGRHRDALDHLLARRFHPWEGGEGRVASQYVVATTELAREAISEARYDDALERLDQAQAWPESLGEGKLPGIQEKNIEYFRGLACQGAGQMQASREAFAKAATGDVEPTSAMYYNDQPPEMAYYQGLACRALDRENEAQRCFEKLIDYGKQHLSDEVVVDFFAVSLPDFSVFREDWTQRNVIHCHFMMGLGYLGMGEEHHAAKQFALVLSLNRSHLGTILHTPRGAAKNLSSNG